MSKYNSVGEILEEIFKHEYSSGKGVRAITFKLGESRYQAWGYVNRLPGGKLRYNIVIMEKRENNRG